MKLRERTKFHFTQGSTAVKSLDSPFSVPHTNTPQITSSQGSLYPDDTPAGCASEEYIVQGE